MAREFVALFMQEEGEALIRRHCRQVGLDVADLKHLVEEFIKKHTSQNELRRIFDGVFDTSVSDGGPPP